MEAGIFLARKQLPLPKGAAAALIGIVCLAMILPVFSDLDKIAAVESIDWREVYFHQGAARDAVLLDGTFPFWCPYVNGGFLLAGHPYDPSFSPLFPITLLAGELTAPRINTFLIFVGGVVGMALLTGVSLRFSNWGVLAGTLIYAASAWLPARFIGGNYNESFFYLFPLILFCVHQASRDRRLLLAATLLLYLLLCEGKFVFPVTALYLAILCLPGRWLWANVKSAPTRWRMLSLVGAAILCSCLVGATKMHLLGSLLRIEPRTLNYKELRPGPLLGPVEAMRKLCRQYLCVVPLSDDDLDVVPHPWQIGMGADRVGCGLIPVCLAIAAGLWAPRKHLASLVLLALSILLSLARHIRFDLFYPLSMLPIFHSIGDPSKYFNYFILLFVSVGTGGFFQLVFQQARPFILQLSSVVLLVIAVFAPMRYNIRVIPATFVQEKPEWKTHEEFFQVAEGLLYVNIRRGFGIVNWHSGILIPTTVRPRFAFRPEENRWVALAGYRGEAYLLNGRGSAELRRIGYNAVEVSVVASAPDRLVVNQNYAPGWRSDRGIVKNHAGLLAVDLAKPGKYAIRLTYRPPGIGISLSISVLSLLILGILVFTRREGRGAESPESRVQSPESRALDS